MLKKYSKYILRGFVILIGILFLLYVIVFAYISINKKKIIAQVTEMVGKKLSGKVDIGNVELSFFRHFPQFSVLIHKVSITDTMFNIHHHVFFEGDEVSARLSFAKLIKKQPPVNGFRIDRGSFYIYTDTAGYTNAYLLHPKRDSTANSTPQEKNELKSIVLNNVHIVIDDQKKNKLHDVEVNDLDLKLDDKDSTSFLFDAKANIFVHSLAFNLERGSFIKEKNTGKILITGLENKDYNNIDFNKKPKTVPQYLGQNEYVFEGKNEK